MPTEVGVSVVDDRMPESVGPYWLAHGQPVSDLAFLFPTLAFDGSPDGKVFAEDGRPLARAELEHRLHHEVRWLPCSPECSRTASSRTACRCRR